MDRKLLFNIIKDATKEYNTISKLENIKTKIPTFFDMDFKDIADNKLLCRITNKYLDSDIELSDKYKDLLKRIEQEPATNPIIIGVAGTWGKTTTCNMLYRYLRACGKHVCLFSSTRIENPLMKYEKNNTNINSLSGRNDLYYFLKTALISNPEYIIIEVHEHELIEKERGNDTIVENWKIGRSFRNIFDNLVFDYKILTSYSNSYIDPGFTVTELKEAIKNFIIPTDNTISLIYADSCDILDEIISSYSGENIHLVANSHYIRAGASSEFNSAKDELITNYSKDIYCELQTFFSRLYYCEFSFKIKNTTYSSIINSTLDIAKDSLLIAALANELDFFNKEIFDDIILNGIEKSDEIIKLSNNRLIIITPENFGGITYIYKLHDIYPDFFEAKPQNGRVICLQTSLSSVSKYGHNYSTYVALKENAEVRRKHDWIDSNIWQYLDKLIIAPGSPGELDPQQACNDVKEIYDKYLPSRTFELITVPNRKKAIEDAVFDLKPNDILIISGRGKRASYYCTADAKLNNGYDIINFTDEEVVLQSINDLSSTADIEEIC